MNAEQELSVRGCYCGKWAILRTRRPMVLGAVMGEHKDCNMPGCRLVAVGGEAWDGPVWSISRQEGLFVNRTGRAIKAGERLSIGPSYKSLVRENDWMNVRLKPLDAAKRNAHVRCIMAWPYYVDRSER